MDFSKQVIVAHRGASALVAFENTLEAFQKAIDIGCTFMEFDVRRTKDLVMVSYHDEYIEKDLRIKDLSYEELNSRTLPRGFLVPTLEQILILSKGKIKLDIELKEAGYESDVIQLVLKHLDQDQFVITSFLDSVIIKIKNIDNRIKTGMILGVTKAKWGIFTRLGEVIPIVRIRRARPDFIVPNYRLISIKFIQTFQYLKLPLFVWTVNDEKMIATLLERGIVAIITDRPDIGLKILSQRHSKNDLRS